MSWTLSKHTTETQLCRSCLQIPWEDLFRNFAQLYSGQFDDVSDPDNPPKILLCYVLHSNRVEMEAALMQQCDLCQTLITGNSDGELTQKSHSDSLQDEVQVHLHLSLVGWMQDKLPRIGMRTMVVGPARMGQEIRCPQSCVRLDAPQYAHVDWQLRLSTDHPSRVHIANRAVPISPRSDYTIATMSHWLRDCILHHSKCGSKVSDKDKSRLPTRLLKLGTADAIKLMSTTDVKGILVYAALSHCWGKSPSFKTESSNFEQNTQRVLLSDLPATFQDAIYECRSLSIEYLWIDSLCIIQDDQDDWKKECALMGMVYQNACLTIAASRAEGDSSGFLGDRQSSSHFTDEWSIFHEVSKGLYLFKTPQQVRAVPIDLELPLHKRAWTVQERYLATRVVSFRDNLVEWDCLESHHDESGLTAYPNCGVLGIVTCMGYYGQISEFTQAAVHAQPTQFPLPLAAWSTLVHTYSWSAITRPSDRLPALAGIASVISDRTHQKYYAGIWEHWVVEGLAWEIHSSNEVSHYRAPSWSWLSLEGGVRMHDLGSANCQHLADIVEIWVEVDPKYPFGDINGGILKLTGPTMNVCGWKTIYYSYWIVVKSQDRYYAMMAQLDLASTEPRGGERLCVLSHEPENRVTALIVAPDSHGLYKRIGITWSHLCLLPNSNADKTEESIWEQLEHDIYELDYHQEESFQSCMGNLPRETFTII